MSVVEQSLIFLYSVLPACVHTHKMYAWCPLKPEEDIRHPGTGVTDATKGTMVSLSVLTETGVESLTEDWVRCWVEGTACSWVELPVNLPAKVLAVSVAF